MDNDDVVHGETEGTKRNSVSNNDDSERFNLGNISDDEEVFFSSRNRGKTCINITSFEYHDGTFRETSENLKKISTDGTTIFGISGF